MQPWEKSKPSPTVKRRISLVFWGTCEVNTRSNAILCVFLLLWGSFLHPGLFLDRDCTQLFTVLLTQGCLLGCCCLWLYRAQERTDSLSSWSCIAVERLWHLCGPYFRAHSNLQEARLFKIFFLRDSLTTLMMALIDWEFWQILLVLFLKPCG